MAARSKLKDNIKKDLHKPLRISPFGLLHFRNNPWNYESNSSDGRSTHHKASIHTRNTQKEKAMPQWGLEPTTTVFEQFYLFIIANFMKFSVAHIVQRWLVELLSES